MPSSVFSFELSSGALSPIVAAGDRTLDKSLDPCDVAVEDAGDDPSVEFPEEDEAIGINRA